MLSRFQEALIKIDPEQPGNLNISKPATLPTNEISHEKLAHYFAIKNYAKRFRGDFFLTQSEQVQDEKVLVYREILHHSCKLQDWGSVLAILNVPIVKHNPLNNSTLPFYEYLEFRGMSSTLLDICQEISLEFQELEYDLNWIDILKSRAYHTSGRLEEARNILENVCASVRQLDMKLEADALLGMYQVRAGLHRNGLKRIKNTLLLINDYLKRKSSITLLKLKSDLLIHLAFHESRNNRYEKALELYSESLHIIENYHLETKVVSILLHQGTISRRMCTPPIYLVKYCFEKIFKSPFLLLNLIKHSDLLSLPDKLKQGYNSANQYLLDAKIKATQLEDKKSIIWIDHHLGWVALNQGNFDLAEKYCQLSMEGYKELDEKMGLADCYQQLGRIYLAKGNQNINFAKQCFEKAHQLRRDFGNLSGLPSCLVDFSVLFWHSGKYFQSLLYLLKGIYLYWETGGLSLTKLIRTITFFIIWIVGGRDWTP